MGIGSIGVPGLILILVIALIIFGPRKLPEIGSAVGKTMKEFKKATNSLMDEENSSESGSKPTGTSHKEESQTSASPRDSTSQNTTELDKKNS